MLSSYGFPPSTKPPEEDMKKKSYSAKMQEVRAFINDVWLKDPRKFCAACGKTMFKSRKSPCCPNMYIVDNIRRVQDFVALNKEDKQSMFNEFGSSKEKNIRYSLRMPAELMRALQKYFFSKYGEEFLVDVAEGRAFMKEFPQFTMAERI